VFSVPLDAVVVTSVWKRCLFLPQDGTLFHPGSNKCLEAVSKTDNGKPAPGLRTCSDSANQHWVFEERMP
jgi:hypothetical protein